ncbi:MAG TPA: DUF3467 domain-containing protein [Elusimicrobiota bacterium]|nr:DUF3467 domain-containing protein [Elusimicrobiota bacterium]
MENEKTNKSEGPSIQIEIDEQTSHGHYANLTVISHSETEFVFDFAFLPPQPPKAKVRTRVIMSAAQARNFLAAFQENVQRYESRFGAIKKASQNPEDQKIGFFH